MMLFNKNVQEVYVLKFFHWEMGYVNTMDIQHDRAGFYICWGCLVRRRRTLHYTNTILLLLSLLLSSSSSSLV